MQNKMDEAIEKIVECIDSMSIDELNACLEYYESQEAYEICQRLKEIIKAKKRDSRLSELGI